MQEGQEFSQKKKILYILIRKTHRFSEIGQDKIMNFKTFSKWVYMTFYLIFVLIFYPVRSQRSLAFLGPDAFNS